MGWALVALLVFGNHSVRAGENDEVYLLAKQQSKMEDKGLADELSAIQKRNAPQVPRLQNHSRPNILFITVDDLNDWVGCLGGNPDAQTPSLDRLARQSVLFSYAHCQVA